MIAVVGCSKAKRRDDGMLPALERYDSPVFRSIRAAMRRGSWSSDLLILSGKYGLIGPTTPIPYYDQRITPEKARAACPQWSAELDHLVSDEEVFINLSNDYKVAVVDADVWNSCAEATGTYGQKLAQLLAWAQRA